MPPQVLILRPAGDICGNTEVVFYDSDKQTRDVMFKGKRWAARRFLRDLRNGIAWETVPAFCEKKGRNGVRGALVDIPLGVL